jgi:hypothetical protein
MSLLNVNKVAPQSGTDFTLGDSGDTFTVPSGATLTVAGTFTQTGAQTFDGGVDIDNFNINGTTIALTAGNMTIDAQGNDTDIIFKGTDGSADTTFLTIDGSAAGAATFNAGVTSGGVITGTAFTAGSAVLAEAELELLDGLTAGTAIASKVVTTDSDIDTTGQRNLTISGELDAATGDFSGAVDVAGTTTAVAITASGLITANADMLIGGTTPTLTIGDAGAEDSKIVFDGNAQDYHIGLDDSADTLVIGKGSALGTTAHIITDANGHVTTPLNPAFRVIQSTAADFANNHTAFNQGITEQYDVNADLAGNGSFTAPVTGTYFFSIGIMDENSTANMEFAPQFVTSNREYKWGIRNKFVDNTTGVTSMQMKGHVLADMDANDTAYVKVGASGTITIAANVEHSYYTGVLIG